LAIKARQDALKNHPHEAFLIRWSQGNWWPPGAKKQEDFTDYNIAYLAHFVANALSPDALRNYDEFIEQYDEIKNKEFKTAESIGLTKDKVLLICKQRNITEFEYIQSKAKEIKARLIDELYERYNYVNDGKEKFDRFNRSIESNKRKSFMDDYVNNALNQSENSDKINVGNNVKAFFNLDDTEE